MSTEIWFSFTHPFLLLDYLFTFNVLSQMANELEQTHVMPNYKNG